MQLGEYTRNFATKTAALAHVPRAATALSETECAERFALCGRLFLEVCIFPSLIVRSLCHVSFSYERSELEITYTQLQFPSGFIIMIAWRTYHTFRDFENK